jgi:pimeloyl-ACP methyl ester carboxylesterase
MDAGSWILFILLLVAAAIGALMWHSRGTAKRAEATVPKAGRTTPVRGGRIHWVEAGQGPPVVMIHGLAGVLQHWTYDVIPRLQGEFRCVALDRPGCGYSERDEDALAALPDQAAMIAEFLQSEGIERPLIVGHSLGGALALTLALDHPERVGGLALIAPLTRPMDALPDAFRGLAVRSPLLRRALGATLAVPMAVRMADRTLAAVFAPEPAPADFVTRGGGALGLRPRAYVAASADLAAVPGALGGVAARYERLETPGGVLYGDADAILDCEAHGEGLVRRLPHLHWEVLAGRGHMLPITAPAETADFIRRMAARMRDEAGA